MECPQKMAKPPRWSIRSTALVVLEQAFHLEKFPSADIRQHLAQDLGVTPRQVQVWFQNRRQRERNLLRSRGMDGTAEALATHSIESILSDSRSVSSLTPTTATAGSIGESPPVGVEPPPRGAPSATASPSADSAHSADLAPSADDKCPPLEEPSHKQWLELTPSLAGGWDVQEQDVADFFSETAADMLDPGALERFDSPSSPLSTNTDNTRDTAHVPLSDLHCLPDAEGGGNPAADPTSAQLLTKLAGVRQGPMAAAAAPLAEANANAFPPQYVPKPAGQLSAQQRAALLGVLCGLQGLPPDPVQMAQLRRAKYVEYLQAAFGRAHSSPVTARGFPPPAVAAATPPVIPTAMSAPYPPSLAALSGAAPAWAAPAWAAQQSALGGALGGNPRLSGEPRLGGNAGQAAAALPSKWVLAQAQAQAQAQVQAQAHAQAQAAQMGMLTVPALPLPDQPLLPLPTALPIAAAHPPPPMAAAHPAVFDQHMRGISPAAAALWQAMQSEVSQRQSVVSSLVREMTDAQLHAALGREFPNWGGGVNGGVKSGLLQPDTLERCARTIAASNLRANSVQPPAQPSLATPLHSSVRRAPQAPA